MIDIHTHVLPGIDDGADGVQTSAAMLERAKSEGVRCLVFTPHYYGRLSPEQFLEKRKQAFEEIREKIPDGLETRLGAEIHFTGVNVPDFDDLCSLGIEGTSYVLLEFPFTSQWTSALLDTLADFISDTGYTPIIAHVERYAEVLQNPSIVSELVEMGCLIQVNAESFCGKYSKKFTFALLKHGLVHCIGTDAHDLEKRPAAYQKVREEVERAGYAEQWQRAQDIMKKIIRGEQVRVERKKPIKKFLGRYF